MQQSSVYTEQIDNQVNSSVKAYIKVKQFPSEIIPRNKKRNKRKRSNQQCLAAKQATMSNLIKQTPIMIADLVAKCPIQCEPDLPKCPEQSNPIRPTSEHAQEVTPCVNRKRSQDMTKSDELVLDMLNQKQTMWDVPITIIEEEFIHAVITSGLTGHLCQDAVHLVLKSIQIKLVEDSKVESIDIPVFRKNPIYKDGVVNLFCEDQKSFDWLEMVVVNPDLMGGMPLVINRVDAKGKFLCAIIIPDRDNILKNPRFILRLLMRQNCWIDVKSWQFVGSEPQSGNYFMKVLVPKEHLDILVSRGRRLAYSISSVYIKFLGQAQRLMFKMYQSL